MKIRFEPKQLLEINAVNEQINKGKTFVDQCELQYEGRVLDCAQRILDSGCRIVLISGPSASGKTTSSLKLSRAVQKKDRGATVVSLDNFFRNKTDYPKTSDGAPDMEHIQALDVGQVNTCLKELVETGVTDIPVYDFLTQKRSPDTLRIEAKDQDIVLIEGIHALNPILSESISDDSKFRIYVGLRAEYSQGRRRVVATRDLRITRRLVRDAYFRGHSVRDTLELWDRLQEGEEQWIKPFKPVADMLLDTSFLYEPGLFGPVLEELCRDAECGGEFRDVLLKLLSEMKRFSPVDVETVPKTSMLREFVGGLELA